MALHTELLNVKVMRLCDRAKICGKFEKLTKSQDVYTQNHGLFLLLYFYMFFQFSFTFMWLSLTHFFAQNFHNLSFDCTRKSTFKRCACIHYLKNLCQNGFFMSLGKKDSKTIELQFIDIFRNQPRYMRPDLASLAY